MFGHHGGVLECSKGSRTTQLAIQVFLVRKGPEKHPKMPEIPSI